MLDIPEEKRKQEVVEKNDGVGVGVEDSKKVQKLVLREYKPPIP